MTAPHTVRWSRLALLACLVAAGACRRPAPTIAPISPSTVIVAFGNSLTAGVGAGARSASYPALLQSRLGCRVVNAGVSGEETSAGLKRLPTVLKAQEPDVVILCHGGNDMLGRKNEDALESNLDRMISLARRSGADVILVGVPKPGLTLRVPRLFHELAAKHHIPIEAEALPHILSNRSLKSDLIHANAAGYKYLAKAIQDLILKSQPKR